MRRHLALLLALPLLVAAAEKKAPSVQAENEQVAISATLYLGKDAVREQLGSDLDGYFILVGVEVTPKQSKPLAITRDDFLLRSYKDGQKSAPFAPSQIAGRGALVVGTSAARSGTIMADEGGPVWGPGPGGAGGPPSRLPGSSGNVGNTPSYGEATATVRTGGKEKENPVLEVLRKKVLPEGKFTDPVSGLLYFSLEGKHKPKDLQLQYNGPAGKLALQFRNP